MIIINAKIEVANYLKYKSNDSHDNCGNFQELKESYRINWSSEVAVSKFYNSLDKEL